MLLLCLLLLLVQLPHTLLYVWLHYTSSHCVLSAGERQWQWWWHPVWQMVLALCAFSVAHVLHGWATHSVQVITKLTSVTDLWSRTAQPLQRTAPFCGSEEQYLVGVVYHYVIGRSGGYCAICVMIFIDVWIVPGISLCGSRLGWSVLTWRGTTEEPSGVASLQQSFTLGPTPCSLSST